MKKMIRRKPTVTDEETMIVPQKRQALEPKFVEPVSVLPKIVGHREARFPGILLVKLGKQPNHPAFPKLDPKMNFPETYYKWNPKKKEAEAMVAFIREETWVAWISCGRCHYWWKSCTCPNGVVACRSVEYIIDQERALARGEEWDINHPDYRGTLHRAEREARADAKPVWVSMSDYTVNAAGKPRKRPYEDLYVGKDGRATNMASSRTIAGDKPIRLLRKAKDVAAAAVVAQNVTTLPPIPSSAPQKKRILTKTKSGSKSSDSVMGSNGEVDLGKLDIEANASTAEMTEKLMARMGKSSSPPKKVMKKIRRK